MALYRYVKTYPIKIHSPIWISFVLIGCGMLILSWVVWPILSFKLAVVDILSNTVSPVTDIKHLAEKSNIPQVVVAAGTDPRTNQNNDYNNPNVWFPAKPQKRVVTPVNSYFISIPKLRIKDATVTIAGDDLNHSLIHYGGTALPGEYGTTVIFGHSTLPQLYDPTNYHTIFSELPSLKAATSMTDGDDIFITYDGITYKYIVYDMVVTKPEDLSSLEQRYDNSYVTLVTCVPPGTYWERLNVKAKLVPY